MLALLTATQPVECDQCCWDAAHVLVNRPTGGFAVQLCPLHLAVFLQRYLCSPEAACDELPRKRPVKADQ